MARGEHRSQMINRSAERGRFELPFGSFRFLDEYAAGLGDILGLL